ncbi:uncharacterized protein LOC108114938 [Drosophila eugracilis]|uniref:uncharacterized protein LOC108114938 n=1 Tax=Drosophila eugracilis TaxID=29029 RepID=UPI0007E81D7B|nr:uncharacterized protein LOC108114938 [Drosophila eugracilis]
MPKRVIKSRQRRAAQPKRRTHEKANQNGPLPNNDIDVLVNKKVKEIAEATFSKSEKDYKPLMSSSMPANDGSENVQLCDALQKTRKSFLSAIKTSAPNLERGLNNTISWYDHDTKTNFQGSITANKATETYNVRTTTNSILPLVSKICKQIKSQFDIVLPKGNVCVVSNNNSQKLKNIGLRITPDFRLTVNVDKSFDHDSIEFEPTTKTGQIFRAECLKPEVTPKDQKSVPNVSCDLESFIKVLGNSGYFVLTGTNAQLKHQFSELAARNVVVQSYTRLPSEMVEKLEGQFVGLERNRQQILENIAGKHATLAQQRVPREKKHRKIEKKKYF